MVLELVIFIIVTLVIILVFAVVYISSEVAPVLDYEHEPYHNHKELFETGAFADINIEDELGENAFFEVYNGPDLLYSSRPKKATPSIAINYLEWIPTVEAITIKLAKLPNSKLFMSYLNSEEVLIDYYIIQNNNLIDGMAITGDKTINEEMLGILKGYYQTFKIRRVTLHSGQIVVFFTPNFVLDNDQALQSQLATIAIALLCIVTISTMLYLSRINSKITKPLQKLQVLIEQFEVGKVSEKGFLNGPKEFMYIVNKFDQMSLKTLKLQKEKEQSHLNKQKLLSEISHDLKTPMAVIKSYAKALGSDLLSSEEKQQYLTTIVDKIDDLSGKIDEFYLYNKLESPDLPLNLTDIDIYEYVRSYLIAVYDDITSLGCQLDIDIPEQHTNVKVDVKLMNRALDNIIFNSVKHNRSAVKIQVSLYSEQDNIVIRVRDNGKGIPNHILNDIFKPYVTDDVSKPADQGSGLGLAIARRIVEKHSGQLTASAAAIPEYSIEFCIRLTV